MTEVNWKGYAESHTGHVRQMNQDAVLVSSEVGLWAVADGMGGHEAGDVASQMIVDALAEVDDDQSLVDQVDAVEDTLIRVNESMRDFAQKNFERGVMGSTIVLLLIRDRVGVVMWAGDSRCYRVRDGAIEQVTVDHRLVEDLLRKGEITEQEALNHPKRNAITRAVGAHETLYLDWTFIEVQPYDSFMLCSDGLYSDVSDADVLRIMRSGRPDTVAARLVGQGLQSSARDNLSAVVVYGS